MSPIIRAEGIAKSYGDTCVLRGVNLSIKQGEAVAIVGRSGSGKTTLLNVLATLDPHHDGTCHYAFPDDGMPGSQRSLWAVVSRIPRIGRVWQDAVRRRHIGFVFQTAFMLENFPLEYNVRLATLVSGKPIGSDEAQTLMSLLGIDGYAGQMSHQLSGGQRQRGVIARAIATEPRVVFADEPRGSLDDRTAREVMEALSKRCKEIGAALVLVTHHPGDAAAICDRVVGIWETEPVGEPTRERSKAFDSHEDQHGNRLENLVPVSEKDIREFIDHDTVPGRLEAWID